MSSLTIVGISGSLRAGSYNTALLHYVQSIMPPDIEFKELLLNDLPLYNADMEAEGFPESVKAFREGVAAADGVLIASPEYNYSIPGVLKNAIDWASRAPSAPFSGKPVGVLSASNGIFGGVRGQAHLRYVLFAVNAYVMNRPEVYVMSAAQKFENNILIDEKTKEFLAKYVAALIDWIKLIGRK